MISIRLKSIYITWIFGLLFASSSLLSQQKKDSNTSPAVKHKILLVPFKPVMFMNEIGKAVNAKTHLSYNQITSTFRYKFDYELYKTFREKYATVSLLQKPQPNDTTLTYIYRSTSYKYDLQPGDTTSSGESHAEFDPALQKKHFINNGQLQVPQDYSKRFMNAHIGNSQLLPYINKKYGADIVVFINEVDIKNVSNSNTEDLTESNFRRLLMVQYTILNLQKHYLAKGILTTYFPFTENDPKTIADKYFSVIADAMMKELVKGLEQVENGKSNTAAGATTK